MGLTLEEAMEKARHAMNFDSIKDSMEDELMFRVVEATGNVTADSYGLSMIVNEADLKTLDPEDEIEELLVELEEGR